MSLRWFSHQRIQRCPNPSLPVIPSSPGVSKRGVPCKAWQKRKKWNSWLLLNLICTIPVIWDGALSLEKESLLESSSVHLNIKKKSAVIGREGWMDKVKDKNKGGEASRMWLWPWHLNMHVGAERNHVQTQDFKWPWPHPLHSRVQCSSPVLSRWGGGGDNHQDPLLPCSPALWLVPAVPPPHDWHSHVFRG